MVLNMGQVEKDGEEHVQTTFYLYHDEFMVEVKPSHFSGSGGHEPSREDVLFAPFYPDPLQRVLAFEVVHTNSLC